MQLESDQVDAVDGVTCQLCWPSVPALFANSKTVYPFPLNLILLQDL